MIVGMLTIRSEALIAASADLPNTGEQTLCPRHVGGVIDRERAKQHGFLISHALDLKGELDHYDRDGNPRKKLDEDAECRDHFRDIEGMADDRIGSVDHERSRLCHDPAR